MKRKALLIDANNHAWRTWKIAVRDADVTCREVLRPYREKLAIFEPDEWTRDNPEFMDAVRDMLVYGRKAVERAFRYKFLADYSFFLKKHRPTEVVIAIDDRGKNWRHTIFPDYKGQRKYEPDLLFKREEIREVCDPDTGVFEEGISNHMTALDMFGIYKEIVSELAQCFPNLKVMVCKDIEGDDIIAVYVKNFHKFNECVIVSNDKDFPQLLSKDGVSIWNQHKKAFTKVPDPERYLLIKTLVGDTSDNISNVQYGIGEKTAEKYIDCVDGAKGKYLDGLDGLWKANPKAKDQFLLNKQLIDMSQIPIEIENQIMDKYSKLDGRVGRAMDIRRWLKYIKGHVLRGLINDHSSFVQMMKRVN